MRKASILLCLVAGTTAQICDPGATLVAVAPNECPVLAGGRSPAACDVGACCAYCAGRGECGTDNTLSNCDGLNLYVKHCSACPPLIPDQGSLAPTEAPTTAAPTTAAPTTAAPTTGAPTTPMPTDATVDVGSGSGENREGDDTVDRNGLSSSSKKSKKSKKSKSGKMPKSKKGKSGKKGKLSAQQHVTTIATSTAVASVGVVLAAVAGVAVYRKKLAMLEAREDLDEMEYAQADENTALLSGVNTF